MNYPALTQLQALGYQVGERVYVRALLPKNIPLQQALKVRLAWEPEPGKIVPVPIDRYLTLHDGGATFTRVKRCSSNKWIECRYYQDGFSKLKQLNELGYGIYFVVNPSVREDADIDRCLALFYECDRVSKQEQWSKIDELTRSGFEPSLVIETKNSLHAYFRTQTKHVSAGVGLC